MQKLNHLSKALNSLGHRGESLIIQKLARKYVETVAKEGLSTKFYTVTRAIQNDLYNWRPETINALASDLSSSYPDLAPEELYDFIDSCFSTWTAKYSSSIGAADDRIPPWLFSFLEEKVFTLIKEAFSEAIDTLPKDSETKAGLQGWLSATTLNQLGVSSLYDLLDGGGELWTTCVSNIVHEIHHNILNHSAWSRFSTLGSEKDRYNLLDAMEEGITATLQNVHRLRYTEDMYNDLSRAITDYIIPILKRMIALKIDPAMIREIPPGKLLLQHWSEIDAHLDQIVGSEMGVKVPEQKILFLKKVFSDLKDSGKIMPHSTWDDIRRSLSNSTLQVWSETASKEGVTLKNLLSSIMQVWSGSASKEKDYQWDFLTGDDETLLINLMKSLDNKSDLLLTLWNDSKVVHLKEAKKSLYPCIKAKIESI